MNKRIYLASPQMLGNEYKYMEDAMKMFWMLLSGTSLKRSLS